MAYTILNTNGTTLVQIPDGTVDQIATSVTLIGKNTNGYGQYYNENLVQMLSNFANTAGSPPRSPLKGQLWYDTTAKKLNVYDNGFKSISGAIVSATQPVNLTVGDLWYDTTNAQLNIYSNNTATVIGPQFPSTLGKNGWVVPPTSSPVRDQYSNSQQVTVMYDYNYPVGVISKTEFVMSANDSQTYYSTSTATVVKGLTINGDISFTGQLMQKYLSVNIDIDKLLNGQNVDVSNKTQVDTNQNPAILSILTKMFPPSGSTAVTLVKESGLPVGAECRVLCNYSLPSPGYQVRRFIIIKPTGLNPVWSILPTGASGPVQNLVS
jgi:hypothetical protein